MLTTLIAPLAAFWDLPMNKLLLDNLFFYKDGCLVQMVLSADIFILVFCNSKPVLTLLQSGPDAFDLR